MGPWPSRPHRPGQAGESGSAATPAPFLAVACHSEGGCFRAVPSQLLPSNTGPCGGRCCLPASRADGGRTLSHSQWSRLKMPVPRSAWQTGRGSTGPLEAMPRGAGTAAGRGIKVPFVPKLSCVGGVASVVGDGCPVMRPGAWRFCSLASLAQDQPLWVGVSPLPSLRRSWSELLGGGSQAFILTPLFPLGCSLISPGTPT